MCSQMHFDEATDNHTENKHKTIGNELINRPSHGSHQTTSASPACNIFFTNWVL